MFKIIDRYIARNVILMVICCTIGLVALSSLNKYVDQMRNIGKDSYGYLDAAFYVFYTMPGQLVTFFPLGVLLGVVLALGNLASSSELIVMQALGKSRLSIVFSAVKGLVPLIIAVLLVSEFVMPKSESRAETFYSEARSNGQIAITSRGVWFKEDSSFILINFVMTDGTLNSIIRYTFTDTPKKQLKLVERAQTGSWQDGVWVMKNVSIDEFSANGIKHSFLPQKTWRLRLTPDKVAVVGVAATDLSIRGLMGYISYMQSNGQKVERYQLELYRKIIQPFMLVVIVLLAASTIFGPLRSASMGARIVVGIVTGFIFYAVNEILAPFTVVYGIHPIIGALMPSLLVFCIGFYLLRKRT